MSIISRTSILLALFAASWLVFTLVSYGLAILVMGVDPDSLGDLDNYSSVQGMKFAQAFMTVGIFVAPVFVYRLIVGSSIREWFSKANFRVDLLFIAALILVTALPLISFLAAWNSEWIFPEPIEYSLRALEDEAMKMTYAFLKVSTPGELVVNIVVIAVLPAICEELYFRGAMQQWAFKGLNKHVAIWLTAIIFSFIHFQPYGFVPRALLGGLFGYLAVWGGSLIYPMVAHFVNNALMVVLIYYINKNELGPELETFGANEGEYFYVLISLFLVIVTLSFYRLIILGNATDIDD